MLLVIVIRTLLLHKKHFHSEKAKIGKNDQSSQISNSGNADRDKNKNILKAAKYCKTTKVQKAVMQVEFAQNNSYFIPVSYTINI